MPVRLHLPHHHGVQDDGRIPSAAAREPGPPRSPFVESLRSEAAPTTFRSAIYSFFTNLIFTMHSSAQLPLVLDGAQGEGGGQILRSSLTLSIITGRPFRLERIRAGRKKPGLKRQHLAAVRAAARISGAEVAGAELDSMTLEFAPQPVVPGDYRFAIGSAGSAPLVFQTIAPALFRASGASRLILEGGTHNPFAPPYDFIAEAFGRQLKAMGYGLELTLEAPGFFPAGGGRFLANLTPPARLRRFSLLERGASRERRALALVHQLDAKVGERELKVLRRRLDLDEGHCRLDHQPRAHGPGNAVLLSLDFENVTEVFVGFGQQGVAAEKIAHRVADEAERYLEKSDAPVGDYLADQLLLPLALGVGGEFRCTACTPHFHTNKAIIEEFLDVTIQVERESRLAWRVRVEG